MVVQHNMTAANANRMLGQTAGALAKSTEKLSSGFRINRAADDAAGLTISEKMRKQINGLDQASTNAQDGVSAVQTAEGALTEVHSMLQRMNELAVQSANGTNSESDRDAIQAEIDQLTTEIDRVAETTKFNETYLLKGDKGTKDVYAKPHDAGLAGSMGTVCETDHTVKFTATAVAPKDTVTIGGKEYAIVTSYSANATADKAAGKRTVADAYNEMSAELLKANGVGVETAGTITGSGPAFTISLGKNQVAQDLSFNLHVGADADMTNKIGVKIEKMDSAGLGIKNIKVDGADDKNATYAIDAIADAIQKVSAQRSSLGAVQNRLEHTIKNLDNVVENTTAAESRIRDTDMAEEMVSYSKNNILQQAGQSMLAQANQANQGVLSLLG